jgi:hypothetical protein
MSVYITRTLSRHSSHFLIPTTRSILSPPKHPKESSAKAGKIHCLVVAVTDAVTMIILIAVALKHNPQSAQPETGTHGTHIRSATIDIYRPGRAIGSACLGTMSVLQVCLSSGASDIRGITYGCNLVLP